jgi:hypothetical protein
VISASNVATGLRPSREEKQLAACRVEGTLLGFGLSVGEQRPAFGFYKVENDLFDGPFPQPIVDLHPADDLSAEKPDVVAVTAEDPARQLLGQQVAQEWLEVFHHPLAGRDVLRLIGPSAWPLIEVGTVITQGVGSRSLLW